MLLERARGRKNGNRWYYRSVPRTVRFLSGQRLIEVPGIIEWINNREYEVGVEKPGRIFNSHLDKTTPSFNKPRLGFWGFLMSIRLHTHTHTHKLLSGDGHHFN